MSAVGPAQGRYGGVTCVTIERAASDDRGDRDHLLLMLLLCCSLLSSLLFRFSGTDLNRGQKAVGQFCDTNTPLGDRALVCTPGPGASVSYLVTKLLPLSHRHVQGGTRGLFMSIHRDREQLFLLAGLTGRSVGLNLLHSLCRQAH